MTVLGIETATHLCGAALVRRGNLLAERFVDERNVHAERLMELIQGVTADHGRLEAVEGIAVSIGPGSFTGLRIGASIAKGLAFGGDKLLIGVPTLQALIERARRESPVGGRAHELAAVLPARRGEYFMMRESTGEVRVVRRESVVDECRRNTLVLTGDTGGLKLTAEGAADIPEVEDHLRRCSASSVAYIGERMFLEGRRDDIKTLEPRYLLEFFLRVDMMERT